MTKIKIRRFNNGRIWEQSYYVPVPEDGGMSVMNALDYIQKNQDPTLAYFSHAACRQSICGCCLVKMNGRVCLACREIVYPGEIAIEPWNEHVIRDLVCQR